MSIFLQGNKAAILWNPKADKEWFTFNRGKLETDNPKLIHILRKHGYEEVQQDIAKDLGVTEAGNEEGSATTHSSQAAQVVKRIRTRLAKDLK